MSMQAELVYRSDGEEIVVDEDGDEWEIISDDGRYRIVEREEPDHWACGIFGNGSLREVAEGHEFDINNPGEWKATRTFGWVSTDEED